MNKKIKLSELTLSQLHKTVLVGEVVISKFERMRNQQAISDAKILQARVYQEIKQRLNQLILN